MSDIDHEWWKKTPAELEGILRDDQKAAFRLRFGANERGHEGGIPYCCRRLLAGGKDLLGDVPVMFATNLKRDGGARMIDHAYRRFVKTGRINPQEPTS